MIELHDNIEISVIELRDQISKQVEIMNKQTSEYSRVLPQNVLFLEPGQRFPVSQKGSLMRNEIVKQYKDIIDKTYLENEISTINALPTDSTAIKVKKIIHSILGVEVALEDNIIELGLDSLTGNTFPRIFLML